MSEVPKPIEDRHKRIVDLHFPERDRLDGRMLFQSSPLTGNVEPEQTSRAFAPGDVETIRRFSGYNDREPTQRHPFEVVGEITVEVATDGTARIV